MAECDVLHPKLTLFSSHCGPLWMHGICPYYSQTHLILLQASHCSHRYSDSQNQIASLSETYDSFLAVRDSIVTGEPD